MREDPSAAVLQALSQPIPSNPATVLHTEGQKISSLDAMATLKSIQMRHTSSILLEQSQILLTYERDSSTPPSGSVEMDSVTPKSLKFKTSELGFLLSQIKSGTSGLPLIQSRIKSGTSDPPLFRDKNSKSNRMSARLIRVPTSCVPDGYYFNLATTKHQAQAAPPHGVPFLEPSKTQIRSDRSVNRNLLGHSSDSTVLTSNSPAESTMHRRNRHRSSDLKILSRQERNKIQRFPEPWKQGLHLIESQGKPGLPRQPAFSSATSTIITILFLTKEAKDRQGAPRKEDLEKYERLSDYFKEIQPQDPGSVKEA